MKTIIFFLILLEVALIAFAFTTTSITYQHAISATPENGQLVQPSASQGATGTPGIGPPGFRGPTGPPQIKGPVGPPPNY